jgi:hypothetical protein
MWNSKKLTTQTIISKIASPKNAPNFTGTSSVA